MVSPSFQRTFTACLVPVSLALGCPYVIPVWPEHGNGTASSRFSFKPHSPVLPNSRKMGEVLGGMG